MVEGRSVVYLTACDDEGLGSIHECGLFFASYSTSRYSHAYSTGCTSEELSRNIFSVPWIHFSYPESLEILEHG